MDMDKETAKGMGLTGVATEVAVMAACKHQVSPLSRALPHKRLLGLLVRPALAAQRPTTAQTLTLPMVDTQTT